MDTDNMLFKSKCAALWRQWLVYFFILLAYIFWATLLQDNQLLCVTVTNSKWHFLHLSYILGH